MVFNKVHRNRDRWRRSLHGFECLHVEHLSKVSLKQWQEMQDGRYTYATWDNTYATWDNTYVTWDNTYATWDNTNATWDNTVNILNDI